MKLLICVLKQWLNNLGLWTVCPVDLFDIFRGEIPERRIFSLKEEGRINDEMNDKLCDGRRQQ